MPGDFGGVSVVLPVHAAVAARDFAQALDSLAAQTRLPDEVIIVADGPLTDGHDAEISRLAGVLPEVTTIRLPVNQGAGIASQTGLRAATQSWVAKVDADDVLMPHRLSTQLEALRATGADVCSAAMTEFVGRPEMVVGTRETPVEHGDFVRIMRYRNPVNHPTAVFRRSSAMAAGGYLDLPYLEDYDLWARMLRDGARFVGVPEPLVAYRTDGMLARRRQWSALRSELALQQRLHGYGVVPRHRIPFNIATRTAYLLLPMPLLRVAYARLFRRREAR